MIGKRLIASAAVGILLLAGCDDKTKTASTPPNSSNGKSPAAAVTPQGNDVRPAIPVSARVPADDPSTIPAEPPHSTFLVADGHSPQPVGYNFPRARLHVDREQKTVVLYSDDPQNAIDSKYVGNGYYLVMGPLSDEAMAHLDGYQWHFKAASSEHQDSADGIFLKGQRYHLQPAEMIVTFTGDGSVMNAMVDGSFYEFDMSQSALEGTLVQVKGFVSATVDAAK